MEKKNKHKEKRKDLRVGMSHPFLVRFQIKKQKGILHHLRPKKFASAKNMSVGGMFIELLTLKQGQLDRIISGQDKLILELQIPQIKRPLKFRGKITRLEKRDKYGKHMYLAGLCFEDIKEEDRERILHQLVSICLKTGCSIV